MIEPEAALQALILPVFEGFYVPVHEKVRQEFVVNRSPIHRVRKYRSS